MKSGTIYLRGPFRDSDWEGTLTHEAAHFGHYQRDPILSKLWDRCFPKDRRVSEIVTGVYAVREWKDLRNVADFALLTQYSAFDANLDSPSHTGNLEHSGTVFTSGSLNVEVYGISTRNRPIVADEVIEAVKRLPGILSAIENIVICPELKNVSGLFVRELGVSEAYDRTKEDIAEAVKRFRAAVLNPNKNADVYEKMASDPRYIGKLELLVDAELFDEYDARKLIGSIAV